MLKKLLPLLALALIGCSNPTDQQLRADFLTLHPGCELDSYVAADGDLDTVWIEFTYGCRPAKTVQKSYALYHRHNGGWHLDREASERSSARVLEAKR